MGQTLKEKSTAITQKKEREREGERKKDLKTVKLKFHKESVLKIKETLLVLQRHAYLDFAL